MLFGWTNYHYSLAKLSFFSYHYSNYTHQLVLYYKEFSLFPIYYSFNQCGLIEYYSMDYNLLAFIFDVQIIFNISKQEAL